LSRRRRTRSGHTAAEAQALSSGGLTSSGPLFPPDSSFSSKRFVDIKIVAPSSVWSGRLVNRDPVLLQFGSWEGLAFYDRMFRQFPTLAGVAHLWADRISAIESTIKAGDPDVGASRELAAKMKRLYRKIPDLGILNKKMAMGRFFGFAATGKADWRIDDETGFVVPHDLYDIPQWYLKFGPNGEEYRVTPHSPLGDPIAPGSIFYYRWGSRFTPYGEADLRDCYLPTWYIQQIRQFGMQALEILGRPIPWVEVPEMIVGEEYDKLEAGLKAQYKYYVITRTSASRKTVTFPTANILANGSAGKAELDYIRYLYGEVYIRILGVQFTQDRTGGSRALESSRIGLVDDKTPPGLNARDQAWTSGWSDHICNVNAPSTPSALYPYFDSDAVQPQIDGRAMAQVIEIGVKLAANEITDTFAERALTAAGLPFDWAHDMVQSTVEARGKLTPSPEPGIPPALPTAPAVPPPQPKELKRAA
jgi:hypothetical protein